MAEIIDIFNTIDTEAEGFFKDRNSKFYAFAFEVYNEEDIKEKQAILRKKFHDARHHVYAYRLGEEKLIYRANDDGEPANSSGKPILGQIQSFDLTNILIVVIRYFGGVKLGVGGLINAYRTAAADAINNGKIVSKTVNVTFSVGFEYPAMNSIMRIIKDKKLSIVSQTMELACSITLSIRKKNAKQVITEFEGIRGFGKIVISD